MALKIPNYADATFPEQAAPDSVDFDAIVSGINLTGVTAGGLSVSQRAAGANLSVDVASGQAYITGTPTSVGSTTNVAVTADATNPRWALITAGSGTATATLGTPAASPVFPAIPAGRALLAAVWIPAAAASILDANIIDKRVLLSVVPATTVTDETTYGIAPAVGTNLAYARQNHTHGTPPTPVTSAVAGTGISVSAATGAVTIGIADNGVGQAQVNSGFVDLLQGQTVGGAKTFSNLITASAGITIPAGQPLTTGTRSVVTGTRATTTNASDTVDLGTFSTTGGAIELRIHAHLAAPAAGTTASVTKVYEFAVGATTGSIGNSTFTDVASGGGGYKLLPADMNASQATSNDFALEVRRSAAGTFVFRFRQISIGVAGTITFTIETLGDTAVTFTPSTAVTTAPTAVTTLHPSNGLVTAAGTVIVGADTNAAGYALNLLAAGANVAAFQAGGTNQRGLLSLANSSGVNPVALSVSGATADEFTDSVASDFNIRLPGSATVRLGVGSSVASTLRITSTDVKIADAQTGGTERTLPRGTVFQSSIALVAFGTTATTTNVIYSTLNSSTITVPTGGRRYRITAVVAYKASTVSNQIAVNIYDGGAAAPTTATPGTSLLRADFMSSSTANNVLSKNVIWAGTLTAGSHTFGVGFFSAAGGGTVTVGDVNRGSYLLVEDIGL